MPSENPLTPHPTVSPTTSATGDPFQRLASFLALAGLLVWNVSGWVHPLLHRHGHGGLQVCLPPTGQATELESRACSSNTNAVPSASPAGCGCTSQRLAAEPLAAANATAATNAATGPGARASSECSHLTCALCKLTKSTHALLVFHSDLAGTLFVTPAVILSDLQPGFRLLSSVARGPPRHSFSWC